MSLEIPITAEAQVMVPQTVILSTKVRGAYLDFDNSQMYLTVDFKDTDGKVLKTKEIVVRGAFYAGQNSALSVQVLAGIEQGVTAILSNPSPVQSFIDCGDIVVKDVATVTDRIFFEIEAPIA